MYIKPKQLGQVTMNDEELKADKLACRKIGPCGVGRKALYLNSFYIDRRYYVPISAVKRVYKRIAMSKGGFSGKGVFATIAYLVVEYDNGQVKQCNFKFEQKVDDMISYIHEHFPEIRTLSAEGERSLKKAEAEEAKRRKKNLTKENKEAIESLHKAEDYLNQRKDLSQELAYASKNLRVFHNTNPSYKWVALVVFIAAIGTMGFGAWCLIKHIGTMGIYFLLGGLAVLLLISASNILPTAKNNKTSLEKSLQAARNQMEDYLKDYEEFPLPAKYAHPSALIRMCRSIEEGRAENVKESFEELKRGLKAANSSVEVSQKEYEEIIAIKPMFLLEDYK